MKTITISGGELADRMILARQRYSELAQAGQHVLLDAPGQWLTSQPQRRPSQAETIITVRAGSGALTETTKP